MWWRPISAACVLGFAFRPNRLLALRTRALASATGPLRHLLAQRPQLLLQRLQLAAQGAELGGTQAGKSTEEDAKHLVGTARQTESDDRANDGQ